MSATDLFCVVDQRTGASVTASSYLTEEQARHDIADWWDRHHRGGRKDITRELLMSLAVIREDAHIDDCD